MYNPTNGPGVQDGASYYFARYAGNKNVILASSNLYIPYNWSGENGMSVPRKHYIRIRGPLR